MGFWSRLFGRRPEVSVAPVTKPLVKIAEDICDEMLNNLRHNVAAESAEREHRASAIAELAMLDTPAPEPLSRVQVIRERQRFISKIDEADIALGGEIETYLKEHGRQPVSVIARQFTKGNRVKAVLIMNKLGGALKLFGNGSMQSPYMWGLPEEIEAVLPVAPTLREKIETNLKETGNWRGTVTNNDLRIQTDIVKFLEGYPGYSVRYGSVIKSVRGGAAPIIRAMQALEKENKLEIIKQSASARGTKLRYFVRLTA